MNQSDYLIVKPDLQYQSAPQSDISINTSLEQTQSEVIDYDRTATLNLATLFDSERQTSFVYRPTLKLGYLYENRLVGSSIYEPFRNSLFYVNPELSSPLIGGNNIWSGYPSYQEFEFIRTDVNNVQLPFVTKSASSYNWSVVLSYPTDNDYSYPMQFFFSDGTGLTPWVSGDGIPFYITAGSDNGLPIIQFNCPVKHGLSVGEYVRLSFSYNGIDTFQIDSVGNGKEGSDFYVFNIYNIGYTGTTFDSGNDGTFKRIIDINNSGETMSKYYVRTHKIITDPHDSIITRNGFELGPFADESFYQFSSLTPNNVASIVKIQSSDTYNVTFAKDVEIINQLDNNKKPVSQIFATIQNVGYFGWWNKLRRGWEFNMSPGVTNPWWDSTNVDSLENNATSAYTRNINGSVICNNPAQCFNFNVNLPRYSGDTMYGDWCEWNDSEQLERVISKYVNKITYNRSVFDVSDSFTTNPNGYYYQVHFPITLKVFSDYLETAQQNLVDNVPNYAYFSDNQKLFVWRDLYDYGFIDSSQRGVDYPFINDSHYPFENIPFRLYPEGASFDITETYQIVLDPIIDGCE